MKTKRLNRQEPFSLSEIVFVYPNSYLMSCSLCEMMESFYLLVGINQTRELLIFIMEPNKMNTISDKVNISRKKPLDIAWETLQGPDLSQHSSQLLYPSRPSINFTFKLSKIIENFYRRICAIQSLVHATVIEKKTELAQVS